MSQAATDTEAQQDSTPPTLTVDQLAQALSAGGNYNANSYYDGDKFPGGFGATCIFELDYYELRSRSRQLYYENLYARGLLRRLITNEINTGLCLEATPEETILGMAPGSLAEWSEDTEIRFSLWAKTPKLCDYLGAQTFGALQRSARLSALINGDVLVVLRPDPNTGAPRIQLITGDCIQNPLEYEPARGHKITHGVEQDSNGRVVAYHVRQDDLSSRRLPAYGRRSSRRVAWLYMGTDKLRDGVRGEPLLSIVLQSLKEVDRYRDSAQRKAAINAMLAMFIKKTQDKAGTLPATAGATRKDAVDVPQGDGSTVKKNIFGQMPGIVFQELQVGEEPVSFGSTGTDINFGPFEASMLSGVAWANEIPPEILMLQFASNYSASQAAINEFKIYLNRVRTDIGETLGHPIYEEWLIAQVLTRQIDAPGMVDAWRIGGLEFNAWVCSDWSGAIKPSTDILKQAKGYRMLVEGANITRARSSRELTGTKFSKNVKQLKIENQQLVDALRPIAEFKAEFGQVADEALEQAGATNDDIITAIEESANSG